MATGQAIQKQTDAALTFARQPKEYVTELSQLLITLQDAYRSKLSEPEQQLWISTLSQGEEQFSMQEIHAAVTEMIKNPPLYEVPGPDGPVTQKWRGMPKLPDLIETMLSLRARRAREAYRQQDERRQQEQRELAKRREEHPEEFFGLADFLNAAKEIIPEVEITIGRDGVQAPAICGMELLPPEPVSPVLMNDDLAQRRIREMKLALAKKFQATEAT